MIRIRVLVNAPGGGRKSVEGDVVRSTSRHVFVRLLDGKIIKRKIERDVGRLETVHSESVLLLPGRDF